MPNSFCRLYQGQEFTFLELQTHGENVKGKRAADMLIYVGKKK
jgi:hypothetical protein